MSVAFAVAPRHTSGADCRCFAQLTFWSLKVIHTRGVNVFSISHRAAVNSWNNEEQPARAGSSPFTYLCHCGSTWRSAEHGKVMEIAVSPGSVGQLPCPWQPQPSTEGMGDVGHQADTSQGFIAFPEPPARPVGTLLLTAAGNIWNSNTQN